MASQQISTELHRNRFALLGSARTLVALLAAVLWIGGVGGVLCHELTRVPLDTLAFSADLDERSPLPNLP